jgi:hypothetical protein
MIDLTKLIKPVAIIHAPTGIPYGVFQIGETEEHDVLLARDIVTGEIKRFGLSMATFEEDGHRQRINMGPHGPMNPNLIGDRGKRRMRRLMN